MPPAAPSPGALVLSLDFELGWGVRDVPGTTGPYRANLLGVREALPRMLDAFVRHGVAATWATVGLLFATSRDEMEAYLPEERPRYADPRLDNYAAFAAGEVGPDERRDPIYFGASLVDLIASAPRQELGSHTFGHLYPMETGVSADAIAADLRAARAIGLAHGHDLRSLVMPRHQVRAADLPLVAAAGFTAHRGPEPNALNRPRAGLDAPLPVRALRLADAYVPLTGANAAAWPAPDRHGLVDVPESRFLRPASRRLARLEPMRVARIVGAMTRAARLGALCHVWWHPHNFGANLAANLANLEAILSAYARLRDEHGFDSLSMGDVATRALTRPAVTER